MTTLLIFPHQLFADHPGLALADRVRLVEDPLFFGDARYPAAMHKQKLWLHRASMARYATRLRSAGHPVDTISYGPDALDRALADAGPVVVCDPVDFMLERRLRARSDALTVLPTPGFLNTDADNARHRQGRKRWFMAEFYKDQRRRLDVLMDGAEPVGGKWSFDEDNRKKVPRKLLAEIPALPGVRTDAVDDAARDSVLADFPDNPGRLDRLWLPTSHAGAAAWLDDFLAHRFARFGDYEDAIVEGEGTLWHSVLTPMLNIGLLTPSQVLDRTLAHAETQAVPLNALEGFVRQIIGWREFMRATYVDLGVSMRTTNHWGHTRPMPQAFYDGTTGLDPVDDAIRRVIETGYCHHIERLMVLGGAMFLCEIDPDAICRWFMEMFVDSYDWVMVPNVHAMSQNADGGRITTKPYFSGSAYVRKMSHWKPGPWSETWDGLYWRWIDDHRGALARNPRWAMMCRQAERMAPETMASHRNKAETFLARL